MDLVAMVGLLDLRGWLLLQERDEHAPVDPNKWNLVGGGVEPDEAPASAAYRELVEETGIACDHLVALGSTSSRAPSMVRTTSNSSPLGCRSPMRRSIVVKADRSSSLNRAR